MRTGKDRVQVEGLNVVVNIGEARVCPGDIVRGDADGVLVIPRAHEDAVLAAAEEIDGIEQRIRDAVKAGRTLAEARRELGYHQLQTRRQESGITDS
jgi:regulator of RNase E activity RraA